MMFGDIVLTFKRAFSVLRRPDIQYTVYFQYTQDSIVHEYTYSRTYKPWIGYSPISVKW